ncbi:uncharacterized protein DS421_17g601200 [Arachis hypogaea]|nr:uncharacterized protein DS421_17g601200 [Arachis hypogaea]
MQQIVSNQVQNFEDWLKRSISCCDISLFSAAIWNIWLDYNVFIFNNKNHSPMITAFSSRIFAEELRKASSSTLHHSVALVTYQWAQPEHGFYKVNCDGSVFFDG